MLTPSIKTPFPLKWGFSTKNDTESAALSPIKLVQVHGTSIVKATNKLQQADGIWTQTPDVAISVTVADCVPILLAGLINGQPWVSAIHAGWRGAIAGIFRQSVAVFTSLGGNAKELTWAFGPSIQKCHFETGEEVIQLARKDPAWQECLMESTENGKFFFDLHGFLRHQALDLKLDMTKDGSIALCTYCLPDLLNSYRRDPLCKRQLGWIMISQ